MNPVALYFASGDSLYPGALLLGGAVITAPFLRSHGLRLLHSLALWLGLALIIMACPPVSGWMAAVFLVAFSVWLIARGRGRPDSSWRRVRISAAAILLVWLLAVSGSEFLQRRGPRISGQTKDHLTVIGDSISSGIDGHTPPWPTLLQQQTGVPVRNLSRAGAGVLEARTMASQVQPEDNLVLIEIGGNDLLSGMSSAEFGEGLESLLSSLTMPKRTVVMFELPLLPNKVGFGRMQRRLSAKYRVFLIPRHFFTGILSGADSTYDGLHLSESGASRMSTVVAHLLRLKPVGTATLQ
jgi:acyl-CoA thioesterase I